MSGDDWVMVIIVGLSMILTTIVIVVAMLTGNMT